MKIIAEFIPMILLLVFLVFSEKFIELGNTVLGKLFFVTLIIFYARINKYLGLMVCFLVITFYNITNPIIKKFENFDPTGPISQMDKIGAQEDSSEVPKLKEQNDYEMKERQMELDAEQLRISQEQRKQEQVEAAKEKEYREAKDIVKNRKNYDKETVEMANQIIKKFLKEQLQEKETEADSFLGYSKKLEDESIIRKPMSGRHGA